MTTNLQECPDAQTLVDFLLGKLPTDAIEDCRQHLIGCDPCVDTIRGLKVDGDTIHDLSRDAWLASAQENGQATESQVIDDLMNRLEGLSIVDKLANPFRTDVAQDRAAEVQRLLNPPEGENDIGKLGKYHIRQLLGAGSTGVVYLAIDEDLHRTVAIKVLRPSLGELARERFIAEARATAMLQHANVVQIYEVGMEGPLAYISMMWEPGQTLEQLLETETNLSIDDVQKLGTKLAGALQQAHQRGLIHRDIKPANVWIPEEQGVNACKVLDFGLVRIADEDPQLTCTGMIAGTPCYMSPEQSRGQQLDGRSDLFSLGSVLYQALTGQLPFRSDNALSTLQSIQRDQPATPIELDPSIPADLSDLVMCLLEKSPNRRPPSAEAVGIALTSQRREWPFEVALSLPAEAKTKPELKTSNGLWKFVATLVIGLGLGVLGLMFGPHITSIVTNHGTIEIDSKVDDVKIEVLQNGQQIRVIDLATEQSIYIKSGSYEIRPMGDQNSILIANNVLTLTRGEKEIVTITRKPNLPGDTANAQSVARNPLNGDVAGAKPNVPYTPANQTPYTLAAGDILGIFIDGVLGAFESSPPVHIPEPGSHLLPSMGFPIVIENDGQISLPLVKPIPLVGKTVSQAKQLIASSFMDGPEPILRRDARILVSLMQKRETNSATPTYRLDSGDTLGIFVEGVLGGFERNPPVQIPPVGSDLYPSIGYPIAVDEDGKISLPLIEAISVRGNSIPEIRRAIVAAFQEGTEPILNEDGRIFVSLMKKRESELSGNASSAIPKATASEFVAEITENPQRTAADLESAPKSPSRLVKRDPYTLDSGDVLGIFIEGVVGEFGTNPPVNFPPPGSGLLPSTGYPWVVDEEGTIALPLIKPITVRGKTMSESKKLIIAAYEEGNEPILKGDGLNIVSLMRKRGYVEPETANPLRERIVDLRIRLENAKRTFGAGHKSVQSMREELKILEQEYSQSLGNMVLQDNNRLNGVTGPAGAANSEQETSVAGYNSNRLTQLKKEYEDLLELFEREAIGRIDLYPTEVKLLEAQIEDADRAARQGECVEFMRKLLEIRESQYELAMVALESPPRPGEDRGATAAENIKARTQARLDLAKIRKQLRSYEQSRNLPSSLPVYNGKTYEECLEIASTDRDLSKLIPAVQGLANLASELEQQETTDAIMRIVRRGTPLASKATSSEFDEFRMAYYDSLPPAQSENLICDELVNGNAISLRDLYLGFAYLNRDMDVTRPENNLHVQRFVDSVCLRYGQEESSDAKKWLLRLLSRYDDRFNCTNADCTALKQVLESAIPELLKGGSFSGVSPNLFTKVAPDAEGLVQLFVVEIEKSTDRSSSSIAGFQELVFAAATLPRPKAQQVLPTVLKKWKRFGTSRRPKSPVVFDYFAMFPAELVEYLPDLKQSFRRHQQLLGGTVTLKAMKRLIEKIDAYVEENDSSKEADGKKQ